MQRLECKAAFEVDETGLVTGKAWDFASPDRVGDIITPEAFAKAVAPLPMLFAHDQAQVVGSWTSIAADAGGLVVTGKLLVNDVARAKEVRSLLQAKAVTGLSVGFMTKKSAPRKGGGRTITDLELVEISIVAVPAHPGARITSAKEFPLTETTTEPTETDIATIVTKAVEPITASAAALAARLDKLEAKANRPAGPETKETDVERKAFANYLRFGREAPVDELKTLTVSSDPQGGYLAPAEMSTEFLKELVEFSPVRSVASIRSTGAPNVIYPTRTGITNAKWKGEAQAQEGSEPSFGQSEIFVKEINTYVDISNQLIADSAGSVEVEVRTALSEDFGQKEGLAFVSGTGTLEPEGLMTNADIAFTANGHATNLGADALISLMYAMPATYRNAGTWALNGTTLAVIRKLKDGQGNYLWQPSYQAGQPESILGRPVIELIDMPDVASGTFPILYGDFSGYRILDRVGLSILVNPYMLATNGITRYHATRRVGGKVLQPAKFRKLKMAV